MNQHTVAILLSARDQASATFAKAAGNMQGFASRVLNLKNLMVGALGGITLKAAFEKAVVSWGVQEQAQAKLAATLRATGGAAGFTANQLQKYAAELQQATIFGDEAIINGQAILATFKQIQGDTFERATRAMLDMTATMGGTDLKAASIQLGKALNDPLKGMSALAEVGVTFSEAQKQQIKQFTALGDVTKAQAVILDELEGEFGGVAAAMAQTSTGAMAQFKNAVGDVWESIGQALTPSLKMVTSTLQEMLPNLQLVAYALGPKLIIATAIAGWAIRNWRDVFASSILSASLSALTLYEDIKHFFFEAIPTYLGWFGRNWKDVFVDALNTVSYAFENFGRNVWTIMGEVWDYITSWGSEGFEEGWENQLRGLMDGFVSVIQEDFPTVANRAITAAETTLATTLSNVQNSLGQSLADTLSQAQRQLNASGNTVMGLPSAAAGMDKTPVAIAAARANQSLAATEARFLGRSPADDAARRAAEDTRRNTKTMVKLLTRHVEVAEQQLRATQEQADADDTEVDL